MKKAIIVGATSGIGKNLAKILLNNNYKVGITGRRLSILNEMKKKYDNCFISCFDITNFDKVEDELDNLSKQLGGLDLLVICAGINYDKDYKNKSDLRFDLEKKIIDTNISGFVCVSNWAFNYFKKQKYGHLLGISSISGIRGNKQIPSYSASKAFQINYLEALRQKSSIYKKIIITDIRPGFVNTKMAKNKQFWKSSVKTAANQIFVAIKNKKQIEYITKRWFIIALILKSLPWRIYDLLRKK
jgi:short-subunit dehydrogenase